MFQKRSLRGVKRRGTAGWGNSRHSHKVVLHQTVWTRFSLFIYFIFQWQYTNYREERSGTRGVIGKAVAITCQTVVTYVKFNFAICCDSVAHRLIPLFILVFSKTSCYIQLFITDTQEARRESFLFIFIIHN